MDDSVFLSFCIVKTWDLLEIFIPPGNASFTGWCYDAVKKGSKADGEAAVHPKMQENAENRRREGEVPPEPQGPIALQADGG